MVERAELEIAACLSCADVDFWGSLSAGLGSRTWIDIIRLCVSLSADYAQEFAFSHVSYGILPMSEND